MKLKGKVWRIIRFIFFLMAGIGIVWYLYRDQDLGELMQAVKQDVNFFWIFAGLMAGLISHIFRTIRWQMMIEPIAKRPAFINTFLSIMIGYLANLVIPRMGEISRCTVLSRKENISFPGLMGTVVAERLLDVISILISLLLAFILQFKILNSLFTNATDFSRLANTFNRPPPYIILALLALLFLLIRKRMKGNKILLKMKEIWVRFKEGFLAFSSIRKKGWFVFHTVMIILFYFLMMYLNFLAFPYTSHLTLLAALTVFVFGLLGLVAPVQGGIGPWHFLVISSLVAYGVSSKEAGIFALVVHSSLNLMVVVCGLISLLILPFVNKNEINANIERME